MINYWGKRMHLVSCAESRHILGVMSGTSADAIDLALVECKGAGIQTKVTMIESVEISWPTSLRTDFFTLAYRPDAPVEKILKLDMVISDFFSEEISKVVKEWQQKGRQLDLIGFAGQTVFHRGAGKDHKPLTLQLGNPAQLARKTHLPVIAEFRTDHIALGYEGAPLSPLAEVLLFSSDTPIVTLNLGGIANITLLPANPTHAKVVNQSPVKIPFSTDTGPANTLMDQLVRRESAGASYDRNGELASNGRVIPRLLEKLMLHPFFHKEKPLSTGPEEFTLDWFDFTVEHLKKENPDIEKELTLENQLRTLCELTVISVTKALQEGFSKSYETIEPDTIGSEPIQPESKIPLYVSGGGAKNPVLLESLRKNLEHTPFEILHSEKIGLDSDFKEAILFAVLANERIAGPGWADPANTTRNFQLGSLYFPE